MPRFFFHIGDGPPSRDDEGTELADIHMARAEAIRMSGETLRHMKPEFWIGDLWKLEATDENGRVLFVLRFSAEDSALDFRPVQGGAHSRNAPDGL